MCGHALRARAYASCHLYCFPAPDPSWSRMPASFFFFLPVLQRAALLLSLRALESCLCHSVSPLLRVKNG